VTRGRTRALNLAAFLPYRLSIVTNRLSRTIAGVYAERFSLTIPEWRIMAVLGQRPGQTADEIGQATEMDKVTVSRAVARMRDKGYLAREVSVEDRRRYNLTLTDSGLAVYARVVPLALSIEAEVLDGLTEKDRRCLDSILGKLERRVAEIADAHAKDEG